MNEERFAKEMKKIQSVVSRALQKANTLAALVDGGKMSREKLQLTLEETAYFFLFPFIGTQTVTPVEREWRDPLPLFLRYAGNGMTSLSGGRIFGCCSSGCMALSTVPMSR